MCSRLRTAAILLGCLASCLGSVATAAEKVSPEHLKFFETNVRPLLVRKCLSCHGEDHQKGSLRLDSLEAILKGGDSGPAIVPGKPDESLLVEAIRYESFEMPPSGKLSDKEIDTLVRWVELGAPWPGGETARIRRTDADKITEEDRQWWSYQPLRKPQVPAAGSGWARNPIDRFIAARLESEGLKPAPEADRATLIRRLYFDLIGLPPSPEEVQAFVNDESPDAYEKLVNKLLDSPQYGERWARHWLDLVRYADSDGYRVDHYRPNAWRYRDYVIRAFNEDKPYDRFVQEQIAGDEMFPGDVDALIATGYMRHWIYEYNQRDARSQWSIILNDITDTTGDVFLGMGMQCARCHDHKFDPILQKDYYRLQAFFAGIIPEESPAQTAEEKAAYEKQLAEWEKATAKIRAELDAILQPYYNNAAARQISMFPEDIQAIAKIPEDKRTPLEKQLWYLVDRQVQLEYERIDGRLKPQDKERVLALRKQLAEFDRKRPSLPIAMTVRDVGTDEAPVHIPGRQSETIAPGFPTIIDPSPAKYEPPATAPYSSGRRTALALWLTQPDNRLTTRVIVNRIWQHHFGRGLADNPSDFGKLGGQPSHPELLDWLTVRFVEDGWSFKKMHRLIVTSATYRQSTAHPEFASYQTRDPENRLYWRADTRRLDAEQIRDAILAVTGQLDLRPGGPGVNADAPRRSIYTRYMRNARDPLLDVFDLPQFFFSESSRQTTTTPIQSLLLINSTEMLRHASKLANRAWTSGKDLSERVTAAWWLAYGRAPTPEELRAAMQFVQAQVDLTRLAANEVDTTDVPIGKVPYRDGQAVLIDPEKNAQRYQTPHADCLNTADFTVEAFFQIRTIYDSGAVRTIVSKWDGNPGHPGWSFGVTGRGSRRKPQTLVMQIHGKKMNGRFGEAAIFSDQHIELNKPYYAAASVKLAEGKKPGVVKFFLKDLSNDDEPLLIAQVEHDITGGFQNEQPLTIGGRSNNRGGDFHGLIDDIRLSGAALDTGKLLFTAENTTRDTLGYWQFEVSPGVFRDSSEQALHLRPAAANYSSGDPTQRAFLDLCHALLNSNEFLYVD